MGQTHNNGFWFRIPYHVFGFRIATSDTEHLLPEGHHTYLLMHFIHRKERIRYEDHKDNLFWKI
jgi:hypothetical protein